MRVSVRRLSASLRPLPNLLFIGVQRGGTSSLYKYLSAHADCRASVRKEIRYFTEYYDRGEDWYRAHFSLGRVNGSPGKLAFDATPDYLLDPRVPGRASALLPHARILVMLRDPCERAFSHYKHNLRLGLENRPFDVALKQEAETIGPDLVRLQTHDSEPIGRHLLRYSYCERGRYAHQLKRWMAEFDRSRFLILKSEDFFEHPGAVYSEILSFLNLREWQPREYRNFSYAQEQQPRESAIPADCRSLIEGKLREDQIELEALLGE